MVDILPPIPQPFPPPNSFPTPGPLPPAPAPAPTPSPDPEMVLNGCDFTMALTALKAGRPVRRAGWKTGDEMILRDGVLIFHTTRLRAHSMPAGDLLAEDWEIF
jgi:hypothetical protein